MFSTFFLCANQTNYTVYNELCTIYIPHTIISTLYFSRRETQNFAFTAWAGALSFIAKNVADGLFFCMHDDKSAGIMQLFSAHDPALLPFHI